MTDQLNIDTLITLTIVIGVAILVGAWIGFKLAMLKTTGTCGHSSPSVVVNVPKDWTPMQSLPPTQIEGARAQLYWSVYQETLQSEDSYEAKSAAEDAVETVFGPIKS